MLFIDDKIIKETRLTEEELRREIAFMLYRSGKLTVVKAAHFAGLDKDAFMAALAASAKHEGKKAKGSRDITAFFNRFSIPLNGFTFDREAANER
jgi:predicted HTH domain antitoxin